MGLRSSWSLLTNRSLSHRLPLEGRCSEAFSPLITPVHGRKMGNEIRASRSCPVVCSSDELNPFKPNVLASQMQGARSGLWTSHAKWEDGKFRACNFWVFK